MARTFSEIQQIMNLRRLEDPAPKTDMIEVRDRYNGEYVIPLPEIPEAPTYPTAIPNLVADAIDSDADQANSIMPLAHWPALDDTKATGVRSLSHASIRRRAAYWVWHESQLDLLLAKYYRHLSGYSEGVFVVVADNDRRMPVVELRDPLSHYPDPRSAEDVRRPLDDGFVKGRSLPWLMKRYPGQMSEVLGRWDRNKGREHRPDAKQMWDLVEWLDEDEIVIGVLGPRELARTSTTEDIGAYGFEISREPNRFGHCPVACGRQVSLDKITARVMSMLANYDLLAMLMAMDVDAAKKAIYSDRYVVGRDGAEPKLVNASRWKPGHTGEVNFLQNVDKIGDLVSAPGPMTGPIMDRVESAFRQGVGPAGIQSGLASSPLRTGQAIGRMADYAVEPRIAKMHRIAQRALTLVNESIAEGFKGYYPKRTYHAFSGWAVDSGFVEMTPEVHFESSANAVTYPFEGADAPLAAHMTSTMATAGLISKRTARIKNPYVDDPYLEEKQVLVESIEEAVKAKLMQDAVSGVMPTVDMARILQLVKEGQPIEDAVVRAQEDAQKRQATVAPPPPDGMAMAPETMPGLGAPGEGAEMMAPQEQAAPADEAEMFLAALGGGG